MRYFKLPDLGEGLIEADIVEWHVKAGDTVKVDQLMMAVETAKAIVEIPSPQAGVIEHTFGEVGDTVHIGEPLVEYQGEEDSVSIVGDLSKPELENTVSKVDSINSDSFTINSKGINTTGGIPVSPSVRGLANRLSVDLDQIVGSGEGGKIGISDIEKAAKLNELHGASEKLTGVRKAMAKVMIKSHQQVVPVSIFGDAPISTVLAKNSSDLTVIMAQAIAYACTKEPALNVWFDGEKMSRRLLNFVDLGIAVDTSQGLFVPVLRQVQSRKKEDLKEGLEALKQAVIRRDIPAKELAGATIILTNYGAIPVASEINICRYGTPIVVPPMVAIVGSGAIYFDDMKRAYLPLSLTFDHRCVTGGEATRFVGYLVEFLAQH